jgi:YjbE family integral membrane protein
VLDWLRILGSIILVDLVLSGDNALVIGAVAASLQRFRWIAFVVGGGGAILIRILLTYTFTILFQVPYLETFGGLLLLFVTVQLLLQHPNEYKGKETPRRRERNNFLTRFLKRHYILLAIVTILVADVTTSLDNIIAIAALAGSQTLLLVIGLLLSVTLLLVGSAVISRVIQRMPWLILLAALILAITAAQLVIQDRNVFDRVPDLAIYAVVVVITLIPGGIWVRNYVNGG